MNSYTITPLLPSEKQAINDCVNEYCDALTFVTVLCADGKISQELHDSWIDLLNHTMWDNYSCAEDIRGVRTMIEQAVTS